MSATDPRVSLTFAKRAGPHHHTYWLEIEGPVGAEPAALYADLRAAGWSEQYPAPPPHEAYDPQTFKRLGYQIVEHLFTKAGSEMFKMWGAAEAKSNILQARAILRRHGFTRVPVWNKTVADML